MVQANGQRGRLLALYAEAARLGDWRATAGDQLGPVMRIEAVVRWVHPLLLDYRPMTIALRMSGAHEWQWTATQISVHDGTLTAITSGAPVVVPTGT